MKVRTLDRSIEYFKKNFRENLKKIRENFGYSQVELSESSGFEASYVGKLERGEADPSLESIERICETLDISPAELLLDEVSSESEVSTSAEKQKVQRVEMEMQKEQLRQTEEQLRKMRDRYRSLYQLAPVPLVIIEEDGQITEVNQRFLETFDVSHSTVQGSHVNEFVDPDDRNDFYLYTKQVYQGQSPEPILLRFKHKSDESLSCRLDSAIVENPDIEKSMIMLVLIRQRDELDED